MNENDEWKKKKSQMNQDLANTCVCLGTWSDLGLTQLPHEIFVFVKWFPDNPVCTQDVTLLLWAKLQQVSAALSERKLLHKEKKKRINQNVQLVPRGFEIGIDQDLNEGPSRGGWPETRVQD